MRFKTLQTWLDWQLTLSLNSIELGLERVSIVAQNLAIGKIAGKVITVAGTNGKGSTVANYENWLASAGYSVASYTSPHLLQYNERIKFNLKQVSDDQLCEAFDAIDQARNDIKLTYFEFGTLAALWLIHQQQPDYAILEVGLGGRLDAVNIIDADMVHLTSIGIDHQAWLGNSREEIGFEKAGVLRPEIPVVCNDLSLPQSVVDEIRRLSCKAVRYGIDYSMTRDQQTDQYEWRGLNRYYNLAPVLPGFHQVQNLAGVIAGLCLLFPEDEIDANAMEANFQGTRLSGRFEKLSTRLQPTVYIDVGHNHDAAKALSANLSDIKTESGKIIVLLGMLEDKQSKQFVAEIKDQVDQWWLLTLDCERGLSAARLASGIASEVSIDKQFSTVEKAIDDAMSSLTNQDIMLVTGSFVTVELFLRAIS